MLILFAHFPHDGMNHANYATKTIEYLAVSPKKFPSQLKIQRIMLIERKSPYENSCEFQWQGS
jgi:hypothetical protein